ncbi:MAG: ATPase, partial [Solirubrobacterales bacterium]|nr:ATPase [Solirubrobacterales bacterium]
PDRRLSAAVARAERGERVIPPATASLAAQGIGPDEQHGQRVANGVPEDLLLPIGNGEVEKMENTFTGSPSEGLLASPPSGDADEPQALKIMPPVGDWGAAPPTPVQPAAGAWMALDFDAVPSPPDYVIDGYLARCDVGLLSGDTGMGKSILLADAVAAILLRRPWLGRAVDAERVMVLDEEQPARVVISRYRALGVENEHTARLRYSLRQGLQVGEPGWDAWIDAELEAFRPDLVIIDTLAAATSIADISDNSEAVRIMKALRGIAENYECAVLVAAHHRKGGPATAGQEVMGARQIPGQADALLVLGRVKGAGREEEEDGAVRIQRTIVTASMEKLRDGFPGKPQRVTIESMSQDGVLEDMTVRAEPLTEAADGADELEAQVRTVLAAGPLRPGELAAALDSTNAGPFARKMDELIRGGVLAPREKGAPYALATAATTTPKPEPTI